MDEKYNGYANYQTWLVSLWIDNEESSYKFFREIANGYEDAYEFGKYLEEYFDEVNPLNLINDGASMYKDLLNSALTKVDWVEVAEHIKED